MRTGGLVQSRGDGLAVLEADVGEVLDLDGRWPSAQGEFDRLGLPGASVPNFQTSSFAVESFSQAGSRSGVSRRRSIGLRTVTPWAGAVEVFCTVMVYLRSSPGGASAGTRTRMLTTGVGGSAIGRRGLSYLGRRPERRDELGGQDSSPSSGGSSSGEAVRRVRWARSARWATWARWA